MMVVFVNIWSNATSKWQIARAWAIGEWCYASTNCDSMDRFGLGSVA